MNADLNLDLNDCANLSLEWENGLLGGLWDACLTLKSAEWLTKLGDLGLEVAHLVLADDDKLQANADLLLSVELSLKLIGLALKWDELLLEGLSLLWDKIGCLKLILNICGLQEDDFKLESDSHSEIQVLWVGLSGYQFVRNQTD